MIRAAVELTQAIQNPDYRGKSRQREGAGARRVAEESHHKSKRRRDVRVRSPEEWRGLPPERNQAGYCSRPACCDPPKLVGGVNQPTTPLRSLPLHDVALYPNDEIGKCRSHSLEAQSWGTSRLKIRPAPHSSRETRPGRAVGGEFSRRPPENNHSATTRLPHSWEHGVGGECGGWGPTRHVVISRLRDIMIETYDLWRPTWNP
jgi:hypothetical protein